MADDAVNYTSLQTELSANAKEQSITARQAAAQLKEGKISRKSYVGESFGLHPALQQVTCFSAALNFTYNFFTQNRIEGIDERDFAYVVLDKKSLGVFHLDREYGTEDAENPLRYKDVRSLVTVRYNKTFTPDMMQGPLSHSYAIQPAYISITIPGARLEEKTSGRSFFAVEGNLLKKDQGQHWSMDHARSCVGVGNDFLSEFVNWVDEDTRGLRVFRRSNTPVLYEDSEHYFAGSKLDILLAHSEFRPNMGIGTLLTAPKNL